MPDHLIDSLMRAAAAGLAGNETIAIAAWRNLNEDFPDIAANPADSLEMFFHFDHWVEPMLEGLEKARAFANSTPSGS